MRCNAWAAVAIALAGVDCLAADRYPTVDELLCALSKPQPADVAASPVAQLQADIAAYQTALPTLSPDASAAAWLKLFDQQAACGEADRQAWQANPTGDFSEIGAHRVIASLPPPAHWQALAQAIAARPKAMGPGVKRDFALRLMATLLTNDTAGRAQVLKDIGGDPHRAVQDLVGGDSREAWILLPDDADYARARATQFERKLDMPAIPYDQLDVPDLVKSVGPEQAESLLRRALTETTWRLSLRADKATRLLARRLALENINRLKAAQWELVDSPDAYELFEAMEKRFPVPKKSAMGFLSALLGGTSNDPDPDSFVRDEARLRYLPGLIRAGRIEDAVATIHKLDRPVYLSPDDEQVLLGPDSRGNAYETLRRVVDKEPASALSELYLQLAALLGKEQEAIDTTTAALAREGLSDEDRGALRGQLAMALLAADHSDDGVAALRASLSNKQGSSTYPSPAMQLAKLALALNRPALAIEAATAAGDQLKRPLTTEINWGIARETAELAEALVQLDLGPTALELATAAMRQLLHSDRQQAASQAAYITPPLLRAAVFAYHRAGRHAEVIELLDRAPYWGSPDLGEFLSDFFPSDRDRSRTMGYLAASAFAAVNRKDQARQILDALLIDKPDSDPAYELLIELSDDRDQLIKQLDAMFAADQFQERPLIWKAELLRRAGRFDEAEATVRKAISIDPSDGDQPRGDRMRAYSVLADILEAQGKAEEVKLYRNVMQAIRLAEEADRLFDAGLMRRAIHTYQRALEFFADAYCIQSRLAVQLAQMGKLDEAGHHYRKAYELMPDSFGRIESHCFGCERVFEGELAQRIAGEVFARLVKQHPEKPQVHYLLAYLRKQQDQEQEALAPLREAVRLDPDYVNAWKMLAEMSEEVAVPQADREAATLNLVRLDPLGRHVPKDLRYVRDMRALWTTVEAAAKLRPSRPQSVYPLAASRAQLEQDATQHHQNATFTSRDHKYLATPALAVAETPAFTLLINLMDQP